MKAPKSKRRPWLPSKQSKFELHRRNHSFYNSAQWKRIRADVLDNEPLCRECIKENRITAATVVDHIKPINHGGSKTDKENLQPLCAECHNRKTAKENK